MTFISQVGKKHPTEQHQNVLESQLTETYKFNVACKREPSNSQTQHASRNAQTSQECANVYM